MGCTLFKIQSIHATASSRLCHTSCSYSLFQQYVFKASLLSYCSAGLERRSTNYTIQIVLAISLLTFSRTLQLSGWCMGARAVCGVLRGTRSSAGTGSQLPRSAIVQRHAWAPIRSHTHSSAQNEGNTATTSKPKRASKRWRNLAIVAGVGAAGYLADRELNASAITRNLRCAYYGWACFRISTESALATAANSTSTAIE